VVRWLVEEVHEEAEKVVLVMDNLNTHRIASQGFEGGATVLLRCCHTGR
jgi:hypothetical protein